MNRFHPALFLLLLASAARADGIRPLPLAARDLVYDRFTGRIYASVPSRGGAHGNSVVAIDPETGSMGTALFVGSEPGKLALSDDGQYLYVALDGAGAVRRLDLRTASVGLQFALGSSQFNGPYFVEDMEVLPGEPESVAISRRNHGFSPRHEGVAIYDRGVPRPKQTRNHTGANRIEFGATASRLYGYNNESTEYGFRRMTVDASGVSEVDVTRNLIAGFNLDIHYSDGLVIATSGRAIDPEQGVLVGTFALDSPFGNLVISDGALGRVFFLTKSGSQHRLVAFERGTFLPIGGLSIPGVSGEPGSLIRWGEHGLAFRTDAGQIYLIRTSLVRPLPAQADLSVTLTAASEATAGEALDYRAIVTNRGPDRATGVTLTVVLPEGIAVNTTESSQGSSTHDAGRVTVRLGDLAPGGTAEVTLRGRAAVEGTWATAVRVASDGTDPEMADNEAVWRVTVRPASGPDLVGEWIAVAQTCRRVRGGERCALSGALRLRNRGDEMSPASEIHLFLSADPVLGEDDRLLQRIRTATFAPGGSRSHRVDASLPAGERADGYYLIAVLDAGNAVAESSEANNHVVFGPMR